MTAEVSDPGQELDDLREWSLLERLGRALHLRDAGLQATLAAIVATATDVVPAAEQASINLLVRGRFETQYVSGDAVEQLDALQLRLSSGPSFDASRDQDVIWLTNTSDEPRWPEYAALAQSLGVRSVLSLPLQVDETRLGSLSLYASVPAAFTAYDERVAALCATHAALALGSAQLVENLRIAVAGRDTIGMAKGILMASRRVTAGQAFTLLAERSQRSGRKVVEIAARVVETGRLDGDDQTVSA